MGLEYTNIRSSIQKNNLKKMSSVQNTLSVDDSRSPVFNQPDFIE
jgi:hypothetical protein